MNIKQIFSACACFAMVLCSTMPAGAVYTAPVASAPDSSIALIQDRVTTVGEESAPHKNIAAAAAKEAKNEVLDPTLTTEDRTSEQTIRSAQFTIAEKLEDFAYDQFDMAFEDCTYLDLWKIANKKSTDGKTNVYEGTAVSEFLSALSDLEKPYADAPVNTDVNTFAQNPYGVYLKGDEAWALAIRKVGTNYRLVMFHADLKPSAHNRKPTVIVNGKFDELTNKNTKAPYTLLDIQVGFKALTARDLPNRSVMTDVWQATPNRVAMINARQKQLEDVAKSTLKLDLTGYQFTDVFTLSAEDKRDELSGKIMFAAQRLSEAEGYLFPMGVYSKGSEMVVLNGTADGQLIASRYSSTSLFKQVDGANIISPYSIVKTVKNLV